MTDPQAELDSASPSVLSDIILGSLSAVGGGAIALYSATMPTVAEGLPGPGLFPSIIGWFLVILGCTLTAKAMLRGRRERAAPAHDGVPRGDRAPLTEAAASVPADSGAAVALGTAGEPRWTNAAVVLGGIVFYVLAAELLGFALTMFVVLASIMLVLRSRVTVAILTAVGITAALYVVFELVLLVQLPNGFLG